MGEISRFGGTDGYRECTPPYLSRRRRRAGEKVSELLVNESAWDEGKLEALFGTFVRNGILNTPIGERGSRDEL